MGTGTEVLFIVVLVVVALFIAFGVGTAFGSRRAEKERSDAEARGASGAEGEEGSGTGTALPRAALVLNPIKKGATDLRATAGAISRQEGWAPPLVIETTADDPGEAMAQEALAAGVDLVIAAGGDGTVRHVAEVLTGTDTPMGIVPLGTGNLLARNLGLPIEKPEWALRVALWGRDHRLDAVHARLEPPTEAGADVAVVGSAVDERAEDGRAEDDRAEGAGSSDSGTPSGAEGTPDTRAPDTRGDHVFMVMAGIGYDADVMADTDAGLKKKAGWLAYLEAGSRKLKGSRTKVRVTLDDQEPFTARIRSVLGANCSKVQGGIELVPGAKVDDGVLDVLVLSPKNIVEWMGVGMSILGRAGKKGLHTEVYQCARIVIESETPIEVQFDGDAHGETTYLEMEVDPLALVMRIPTAEQQRLIRLDGWPFGMPA